MTKATDKELGELHALVATNFKDALTASDEAKFILQEMIDQNIELPEIVTAFLERYAAVNPSLLTAAAKFLKDNNITCAIEDSKEMTDLQERLAKKQKRSNVIDITGEDKDFG